MSEATGSSPGSPRHSDRRIPAAVGTAVRLLTYCGLLAAVCVVAYTAYSTVQQQAALQEGQHRLVAQHGLVQSVDKRLVSSYRDTDGDLLADRPTDAQQMVDPERLVLAHYEGDTDDEERVDWPALQARLSEATGKPVDIQPYINSTDDVAAVKAGSIPLVALHSADVPYLVNNAGFVPVAALGTDSGASGNHLVIATGAKSKIKKIDDLRGSKLACTHPYSITGYRAAIAALSQQAGMRPDVDYEIHFSLGQKRSIRGVVDGDFTVAALSADKLQQMLDEGEISTDDYRVIYESQVIPRLTFGYTCRLDPELAARIAAAVLAFKNEGAAAQQAAAAPLRFFPLDYKRDFEFVRQIDNSFDPRFGQQLAVTDAP